MDANKTIGVEDVKAVLVDVLDLQDRAAAIGPETRLIGTLPELDSMAVLELIVALEARFGIEVDGEDVTADALATLSSLTDLVNGQRD